MGESLRPPAASAPDLFGRFNHKFQLRHLVGNAYIVAFNRAREAALRAEGELIERTIFRRLLDPALQRVFGLERRELGGDEAEDDSLALRHETQRREIAGALVVIFEEIAVDIDLVEEHVGDRL